MSHEMQGHPRQMGHSEEFWQNVVRWRRECKDWRQKKGAAEDEMVSQHHWVNGHESKQTWEIVEARGAWRAADHGVAESEVT